MHFPRWIEAVGPSARLIVFSEILRRRRVFLWRLAADRRFGRAILQPHTCRNIVGGPFPRPYEAVSSRYSVCRRASGRPEDARLASSFAICFRGTAMRCGNDTLVVWTLPPCGYSITCGT